MAGLTLKTIWFGTTKNRIGDAIRASWLSKVAKLCIGHIPMHRAITVNYNSSGIGVEHGLNIPKLKLDFPDHTFKCYADDGGNIGCLGGYIWPTDTSADKILVDPLAWASCTPGHWFWLKITDNVGVVSGVIEYGDLPAEITTNQSLSPVTIRYILLAYLTTSYTIIQLHHGDVYLNQPHTEFSFKIFGSKDSWGWRAGTVRLGSTDITVAGELPSVRAAGYFYLTIVAGGGASPRSATMNFGALPALVSFTTSGSAPEYTPTGGSVTYNIPIAYFDGSRLVTQLHLGDVVIPEGLTYVRRDILNIRIASNVLEYQYREINVVNGIDYSVATAPTWVTIKATGDCT